MAKVAVVGLGYFSQFHLRAWAKIESADLVAIVDHDPDLVSSWADELGVEGYTDVADMLVEHDPEIIDLVVPPPAQQDLVRQVARKGRTVICQKPFCRSIPEAEDTVQIAEDAGADLVIHENFRFQPWYREMADFIADGGLGQVWGVRFNLRPGDGRGPNAYLSRQPSFQKMERFLIRETVVHLMDTFAHLFGRVNSVYADLRRLNPHIAGEDAGLVVMHHDGGVVSTVDGNRLSDHVADDYRHTIGEMVVEGENGALSLDGFGRLWFRPYLSNEAREVPIRHPVDPDEFAGGCVEALNRHVLAARAGKEAFQNTGREYLGVLRMVEAAYESAEKGCRVDV